MKIGFVQYDVSKNIDANIAKVENLLLQRDADLFILPELCDCGYLNSKENLMQITPPIESNKMVEFLKKISTAKNGSFVAGVAEKDGGDIYNSAVVISNGAIAGVYRKIHLSDYEKTVFSAGKNNSVFTIGKVKIGVQICFDLWFPEMSRAQIRQGADILCVLANFGGKTTYDIAKTRATENLTPLILCNRVGTENSPVMEAYFLGRSTIIDKTGALLEEGKDDIEVCTIEEIDIKRELSNVICSDFMGEINKHYEK